MTSQKDLLLAAGYEWLSSTVYQKYIAEIIVEFNLPLEYLDKQLLIKYDWQGQILNVFVNNRELELIIYEGENVVYNSQELIQEYKERIFANL